MMICGFGGREPEHVAQGHDRGSTRREMLQGCNECQDATFLSRAFGLGFVFVGVNTAANAGVPADRAGLAAALVNTSTWLGGAVGLAVCSVIVTTRTQHLLDAHAGQSDALTSGFRYALVACSGFLVAAALIALRATNTRGESSVPETVVPALEAA
jgi:hypothetical protein